MKKKGIIILAIIFFVLINTNYYWEVWLSYYSLLLFLLLGLVFLGLAIVTVQELYLLVKERFSDKKRLFQAGLLVFVLGTAAYQPFGLIDFDRFSGKKVLVAGREGGGDCTTMLKLFENHTFRERTACFGISVIKGSYELKGDSILFKDIEDRKKYYSYALIKPVDFPNKNIIAGLHLYQDKTDTTGQLLFITQNELSLLTGSSH
ncbi:MAG: hypothetical protein NTW29_02320 [Bacteroidetes bacterium]|nr:hypothetical protein [Bacteroidota bacterium]